MATPPLTPLGYRPKQVSQIMGVGLTKVYQMIGDGTLESRRIGRTRIVLARSVKALLEGQDAA